MFIVTFVYGRTTFTRSNVRQSAQQRTIGKQNIEQNMFLTLDGGFINLQSSEIVFQSFIQAIHCLPSCMMQDNLRQSFRQESLRIQQTSKRMHSNAPGLKGCKTIQLRLK